MLNIINVDGIKYQGFFNRISGTDIQITPKTNDIKLNGILLFTLE